MINFKELLNSNVEGLTDEAINKIDTLVSNALNERVSEIYSDLDKDIESVTGKKKPSSEKTYTWLKSVLSEYVNAPTNEDDLKAANDRLKELEKELKEAAKNGDSKKHVEGLETKLNDATNLIEDLKRKYQEDAKEWETKYNALFADSRRSEVKSHLTGMKFRDDIPEDLKALAINNAVNLIAGYESEKDADGNTLYRKDGKILTNPDNSLSPFTTSELLQRELKSVIYEGRNQTGAGTKAKAGRQNGDGVSFVLNAKTQGEAMSQIVDHLISNGVAQNDPEHQKQVDKIWSDNKISDLPM